jgi:hypothetical protein
MLGIRSLLARRIAWERSVMTETIYRQHRLEELADPWLRRSLRAWRRIANARGRYILRDDVAPILDNRQLLLPASTLFLVDGEDPLDYVVVWQGPLAQAGLRRNLLGCRWGEYADTLYAAAAARRVKRAVDEAEIAYDEVWADIGGLQFHYDRLALPIMWHDQVELLLTVAKWRSPSPQAIRA